MLFGILPSHSKIVVADLRGLLKSTDMNVSKYKLIKLNETLYYFITKQFKYAKLNERIFKITLFYI